MATWKPEDRTEEQLAKQLGINLWDYNIRETFPDESFVDIQVPDQFKKMYIDEMKRSVGQYDLTDLYYKELIQDAQSGNKVAIDTLNRLNKQRGYSIGTKPSLIKGEGAGLIAQHPGRESTEDEKTRFMKKYMGQSAEDRIRKQVIGEAGKYYAKQHDKDKNKNKGTITPVGYYHPSRLPGKMGGEEQRDWESQQRRKSKKYKPTFFKEDPGFVKKEKFLERIMDKRVAPGEELSNAAKTRLYLKEISKNLLERRKKGGLEGTDTLSRIFGGITEGEEAVTAKEEDILTRREAAKDKRLERDKTVADITKIYAEAQKARLEAYKQDYTKEFNKAAEMAELAGHKPGDPGYNAYILQKMERMETLTMGEGAAGLYSKIAELQAQVQITPEGEERDQLLANIANLTALAGGLGTGNLPENNEQSQEDLMKTD